MSDRICTNCGGGTATGCWMCNPNLFPNESDLAAMSGDCVKCRQYQKRIKELESELTTSRKEWNSLLETAEARLDAVAPYIQHLPDCEMVTIYAASYEIKCTCGLEALEQKDG